MSDLFAEHHERHQRLEALAATLLSMSSLIGLHGWNQSSDDLREAADDAEEAARLLLGEKIAKWEADHA
jgi:hypothetical protein